ncbi:hypothetical protein ACMFMF_006613 [Clarireedia jacksonii]
MSTSPLFDMLIIGGGPAGLTAAFTLARQLHTAVVFGSGDYRNIDAKWMHMVLTWDHKSPKQFRSTARKKIETNYETIKFEDVEITSMDLNFKDRQGRLERARNSSSQLVPQMTSLTFRDTKITRDWEFSFHCLFFHGYEEKNSPSSGVLALQSQAFPPLAIHNAESAASFSQNVTIYIDSVDSVAKDITTALNSSTKPSDKFSVDTRKIKSFVKDQDLADVVIEFEDGTFIPRP